MTDDQIVALANKLVPLLGPDGAATVIAARLSGGAAVEHGESIRRGLERIADKIYMR